MSPSAISVRDVISIYISMNIPIQQNHSYLEYALHVVAIVESLSRVQLLWPHGL